MFCEAALEVGGEAYIQVAVVHGEKDVNTVLEFGGHATSRTQFTLGFKRRILVSSEAGRESREGQCSRTKFTAPPSSELCSTAGLPA
jgi:hypothetical protein